MSSLPLFTNQDLPPITQKKNSRISPLQKARALINEVMEKLTIMVTETGVVILNGEGNGLELSAGEAPMLLHILENEEAELEKMPEEATPCL